MSYFAMVVVVEHDSDEQAFEAMASGEGMFNRLLFVGEPWKVQPITPEPEFDASDALSQHPGWTP